MGLSYKEQIIDQINKSEVILMCIGKNPNGDALGAALGFCLALKKLGKKVDVVSPTATLEKYSFLPFINTIRHKLEGARDYIISVDINKEKLQQLRYEVEDNKLKIFITAKNGNVEEKNVSLESSKFKYDLIIVLDTQDLENLGSIYDENSELFYETPVINIDNNPSNEYFGKINFVDVTASSVAEIVLSIISDIEKNLLDEEVSTSLLTGIISETESFQNKNTTPKSFLAASSLIAKGARKQDIIRYLYRTKSISMLKFVGKVMANLKYSSRYKLGWSIIEEEDFIRINKSSEDLNSVIKELIDSSPEFNILLLLYRNNSKISGIINFAERMPIEDFAKTLNGTAANNQINFDSKEDNPELAERDILRKIKAWLDNLKK